MGHLFYIISILNLLNWMKVYEVSKTKTSYLNKRKKKHDIVATTNQCQ